MTPRLVAIALFNLAVLLAFNALAWWREGRHAATGLLCVFCFFNGIFYAQATVLGTLAALVPKRALVGLILVGTYAVFFGYAMLGVHFALPFNPSGVSSLGIYFARLSIAMLIVLWLFRLALGWRLTTQAERLRRQFQLSDLLELTLVCAAWMGLSIALDKDDLCNPAFVLTFVKFIVQFVLLGVPVFLIILKDTPPQFPLALALAIWWISIDIGLALIPIHDGDFLDSLVRNLPYHAQSSLTFLTTLALNGILLRQTGYRWRFQAPNNTATAEKLSSRS